jgi:polyisoprenoid-binding protein YceI
VLRGRPIAFRSSAVRPADEEALVLDGDLELAGTTRPLSARLDVAASSRVTGTIRLAQSDWGIKPYRGLMGALRVRDDVEITIGARLA